MTIEISQDQERSYEQKTAWVYLLNLGFYFIPLYFMAGQWLEIALSVIILIPFIYGYFKAYNIDKAQAIYPILLMLGCGLVSSFFTSGFISLFSFACFFIGFFYTLNTAILSFIGLSVLMFIINALSPWPQFYVATFGSVICLMVGIFGIIEQNRLRHKRLQQRSEHEISQLATSLERERIARDLHDMLGHQLSSMALKSELAVKLIEANEIEQAKVHVAQLADIARDSLSQIRQTVSNYKHKSLSETLTQLMQTARDKGIAVSQQGDIAPLSKLAETQLAFIMTEVVNNCIKHSHASLLTLIFTTDEQHFKLNIEQDCAVENIKEGNGIQGMRERLALINGELTITMSPQFTLSITIPLSEALAEQKDKS